MNRFFARYFLLIFPAAFAAGAWAQAPQHVAEASSRSSKGSPSHVLPSSKYKLFGTLPVSSKSVEARRLLETAVNQYENVMLEESVATAKKAAEKDSNFALAYAVWAFAARRGEPNAEMRQKARQLAKNSPPEEQLLVRWMTSVEDQNLLPAIASMNDLLAKFPEDKHILYLTSEWLYFQQNYERSRVMMEQILRIDPNFPPALNMLGYSYVESGNPDPLKALNYLRHYSEVQPNLPNPEDSLGEVSRYAGRDDESLEHYSHALKIDPKFITSQIGLGDTSTLMGNFSRARAEYDKATVIATISRDTFHIAYQKALISFWEGKPSDGFNALDSLAAKAHEAKEPYAEDEILLGRALLTADYAEQLKRLEAMETMFSATVSGMSEGDRNPALSEILRDEVRAHLALGHIAAAQTVVAKLEALATSTGDQIADDNFDSTRGFLALQKGEYAAAIDGLSSDSHSPLLVQQLSLALEKSGDVSGAQKCRARLKFLRSPTVEWFLVTHPNGFQATNEEGSAAN